MKELIRDQRGMAPTTVFLIMLLPALILCMVYSIENSRIVESASVDLSDAVTLAVRSAASMVDVKSQANGDPCINTEEAYYAFYTSLCENLGLEPDFEPKVGSRMKTSPEFQLIIYNGEAKYGQPGCVLYTYDGSLNAEEYIATGFPCSFGISDTGINIEGTGDRSVTLETPGAIGFVKGEITPVIIANEGAAARWAAARVVLNN